MQLAPRDMVTKTFNNHYKIVQRNNSTVYYNFISQGFLGGRGEVERNRLSTPTTDGLSVQFTGFHSWELNYLIQKLVEPLISLYQNLKLKKETMISLGAGIKSYSSPCFQHLLMEYECNKFLFNKCIIKLIHSVFFMLFFTVAKNNF